MNEIDIEAINNLLDAKDARIAQLEDLVASKDAEIAFLHEREITLARDGVETLSVVIESIRAIHPGREADHFVRESDERIKTASPEDKPFIINARIKAAAAMIRESPAPVVEGEGRFSYSTNTRTQNRALALVDHMKRTEKSTIKSSDARTVLETIEGKPLDRKIVHRALNAAQSILRASKDKIGGISRLIMPSAPLRPRRDDRDIFGGGGGGNVSRRRREGAPPGG
jgi:hypothetical protein